MFAPSSGFQTAADPGVTPPASRSHAGRRWPEAGLLAFLLILLGFGSVQAQVTYNYTGGVQTYTVPGGVSSLIVDVYGGQGRLNAVSQGSGGLGGRVQATISVTPGEVLQINVGGGGGTTTAGGFNGGGAAGVADCGSSAGGGGGGMSSILRSPYSFNGTTALVVAGGGGGAGGTRNVGCGPGGGGGGGGGWYGGGGGGGYNGTAGGGGTQAGGGGGGVGSFGGGDGLAGFLGGGGAGGYAPANNQAGTDVGTAGGAGGGTNGAGGASATGAWQGGGGGGGSSYTFAGASGVIHSQGVRSGNGLIIITPGSCAQPTGVTANPTNICAGTTVNLNATSAGNTINWYTVSSGGSPIGSTSSGANFAVSPSSTTTYYAEAVGGCTASSRTGVTVVVTQQPTSANAGPDINLCATSTPLAANAASVGSGSWSIISGGGGSFTNANSPTSGFNGVPGTPYTLRWTISNAPCPASTDDVVVYFTPPPTSSNAGSDQSLCGTSTNLTANAPSSGTGSWSIISGAGGTVSTPSSPTSGFIGASNTTYTLRWTIANAPCSASTDDVVIAMAGVPTVANAGPDQTICATGATLAGNAATTGTGAWSIIAGTGGSVVSPGSPTSAFTGVPGNTYTLRWTISNPPCTATSDDVVLTLIAAPTTANAGVDQLLCATNTTLAGNAPSIGTGNWTIITGGGGTIANPSSPTSSFSLTAGVSYTLRWTISNAPCPASTDDVVITTDNVLPAITCPANITTGNGGNQCTAVVTYSPPTGTDNCPSPVTTQTAGLASGATFPAGLTTNTFRVTDAFGNSATCSFSVNVVDNQPPTISCPGLVSIPADPGLCSAVVSYNAPAGADNCGNATTTQISGLANGASFPLGVTNNTFRVVDGAGNSSSCTFTVTVTDNQPPAISCPSNITAVTAIGSCSTTVTYTDPVGTDNCSGAITNRTAGLASGSSFAIGVTNIVFQVNDGAGNTATCGFTVTVSDAELPTINCPANITVGNSPGLCRATVTYNTPVGTDNCVGALTTRTSGQATGAQFLVGTTTNTFMVTDASGNTATCSFTITVNDTEAPMAVCQNITLQLDSLGNGAINASAMNNNSLDNCSALTYAAAPTTFDCSNLGSNNATLTVTDQNGNSSSCTAAVTVIASPVFVSMTSPTNTCGFNVSCFAASDATATASGFGGCPGYTYQWSNGQSTQTATGLGAGTHTVTVTDATGGTTVNTITLTAPPPYNVTTSSTPSCADGSTGTVSTNTTGGNSCVAPTYLWSNGATTSSQTGLAPGIYNVTVTDASGCTISRSVTVSSLPALVPNITQSGNTLSSVATWATYQWTLNNVAIPGANAQSHTISASGTYNLVVTDSNGCSGTSLGINLIFVGSADPSNAWTGMSIYPNPARDEFKLRTDAPIGHGLTVRVHDIYGRELMVKDLTHLAHEAAFDIRNVAAGTYMVEVSSKLGQRKTFKLAVD